MHTDNSDLDSKSVGGRAGSRVEIGAKNDRFLNKQMTTIAN